jgi:hypothetical protein
MTTKCLPKRQDLKKINQNIIFHDVREGKSLVRRWNGHRYNHRANEPIEVDDDVSHKASENKEQESFSPVGPVYTRG